MRQRILLAMFGGPAAIGVLSKLDDRLNLSPFLERLVLNFKMVSDATWTSISELLEINLSPYADLLTFVMLLFFPVCANLIIKSVQPRESIQIISDSPKTLEELKERHDRELKYMYIRGFNYLGSFAFILIILHLFELGDLWIALVLPGMSLAYFSEYYSKSISSENRAMTVAYLSLASLWIVLLVVGVPKFMWFALVGNNDNLYSDVPWLVFLIGGLVLSWLFYRASDYCSEAITNIALWVTGILIINGVTESLIPAFENFLDHAGA